MAMSRIVFSSSTRAVAAATSLRGNPFCLQNEVTRQQVRRLSDAVSRFATASSSLVVGKSRPTMATVLLGVASSSLMIVPGVSVVALCEGKDQKGFFEAIAKKDKEGNTDWAKSITQVTEGDFWDIMATKAGQKVQHAYDTGIPSQLSYGFVCGYCSGYALKTVGRGAALVFGLGFMSLQTMAYYGYIQIDHTRIQEDFERAMDLNKDGKVDKDDAEIAYNKVMEVLQYSLPAGSGFGGGFIAGVRSA